MAANRRHGVMAAANVSEIRRKWHHGGEASEAEMSTTAAAIFLALKHMKASVNHENRMKGSENRWRRG